MRTSGDPDWYEYRYLVPLTGREPVLGRLKARLRSRGPGWGWITLSGPIGAGVSRVLDEVDSNAQAADEPPLLCVRPVPDARCPLAPLRRALRRRFPQAAGPALQRAVRTVHVGSKDEIRVLATWLAGRNATRRNQAIDPRLVRAFLEHLVPLGPVLVHDLQHIDGATLAVLLPSAQGQGFGVVAGVTGSSDLVTGALTWELDPLAPAQVELLLRRWLRHAATARRLAPVLTASCEGWPGRIVEAVRRLARLECLTSSKRGIVVARTPARWPDGMRSANAFVDWVRSQHPEARRVLEVAALQGAPDDVAFLADAAEVTPTFVSAFLAEAAASRGGLAPEHVFATRAARHAYRDRLTSARRDAVRERLECAWVRRAAAVQPTDDDLVRRLHLVTQGGDARHVAEALDAVLARLPLTRDAKRWHLDALAAAAGLVSAGHASIAEVAHRLWHAGQRDRALSFLDAAALSATPGPAHLLAQARRRDEDEARALLAAGLAHLEARPDAVLFDAWAVLADSHLRAADARAARRAWRHARVVRPEGDAERTARWHEGLAACASALGRVRAAITHRRRAVRLRLMRGDTHAAGMLLLDLGEALIRQGELGESLGPLGRAADILGLLGDALGTAEAQYRCGRVFTWLDDYDRAAERLRGALAAAEAGRASRLLPRIHLALAAASRGCGDLANERHHAEMAAGLASTALGRVQAAAVLARADLRAGVPGADHLLVRCERDLRVAGFEDEADRARAALVDVRLRAGDSLSAREILPVGPTPAVERLAAARLDLGAGRVEAACAGFELLAADGRLPTHLRAMAYAHLADALRVRGRLPEARAAAVAASALLEVTRRSRADDARLHDVLARVFRDVGEHGRAVGHRSAARRGMRALVRAAPNPREGRRLMRSFWRRDPRPGRNVG